MVKVSCSLVGNGWNRFYQYIYLYKFVDFNIYKNFRVVKILNMKNRVYLTKEKHDSQIISIIHIILYFRVTSEAQFCSVPCPRNNTRDTGSFWKYVQNINYSIARIFLTRSHGSLENDRRAFKCFDLTLYICFRRQVTIRK